LPTALTTSRPTSTNSVALSSAERNDMIVRTWRRAAGENRRGDTRLTHRPLTTAARTPDASTTSASR
jgi:hypothetical protein